MRWIPTRASVLLPPSTPGLSRPWWRKTPLACLRPGGIQTRLTRRPSLRGSVQRVLSLPLRTLDPRTPARLWRRRSPSRRVVEQSLAARPALAGPRGSPQPASPRAPRAPEAPAGGLLLGCCRPQPKAPGRTAARLNRWPGEGAEEPTGHLTCSFCWKDGANCWLC